MSGPVAAMLSSNGTARWAVYLIECADGRVYTGVARDPHRRYAMHLRGKGARFTRSNPPRQLLGWVWVASHGDALRLEWAWKRLPRAARLATLRTAMQEADPLWPLEAPAPDPSGSAGEQP
jgi:putative endonuclease